MQDSNSSENAAAENAAPESFTVKSTKRGFQKGVSGNPRGRPKGAGTLKAFARLYIARLSNAEKKKFLAGLPPLEVWRMAEGNPHQSSSEELTVVIPRPIDDLAMPDTIAAPQLNAAPMTIERPAPQLGTASKSVDSGLRGITNPP